MITHERTRELPNQSPDYAPLKGVRVLELGNYIAAPTAGRLLADFGADVIKIERPGSGDELRNWRLHEGTTSMLFRTINRNKRSVVIDLSTKAGRDAVKSLVAKCDVVIENFRPGTLEKWGLGPDVLEAVNPQLILSRVSAYGQTGPLSPRPGFAAVAEAFSGFRNLVGDPDRSPVRVGISIGDSIAGIYAAFGVVMELYRRDGAREDSTPAAPRLADRTIDVALHEAMFSVMESLVPDYLAYGVERERTGGRMEGIAPSNAYVCADGGSVVVAGNGDGIFRRYMLAIGREDLLDDPGLSTNTQRWDRREELDKAISDWTGTLSAAEVLRTLDEAGVPAGPINTASDIAADPQYQARRMIQEFPVSTGERTIPDVGFPGIVPVVGEVSLPVRHLGPDLGEHNDEVLHGLLKLSGEEIRAVTGDQTSGSENHLSNDMEAKAT